MYTANADAESRKYQFMQANTERRAEGLKSKIPDIQKTLETVQFLEKRKVCILDSDYACAFLICYQDDAEPLEASFELNDTLFAKAKIPKCDEVYLWLGVRGSYLSSAIFGSSAKSSQANVMLSYPLAEAQTLLDNKLDAAKQSMANCEEDLDFLREQITVRGHYSSHSRCYPHQATC